MIPGRILVVDDEAGQRETLAGVLGDWGHEVLQAPDGETALDLVLRESLDLVLTDLRMPGLTGDALVARCREAGDATAVVVMTAYGTVDTAVAAMKAGAVDFLTKPIDLDRLEVVVARALETRALMRENRDLRRRLAERGDADILGRAPALRAVMSLATRAAETDATVLVLGESGTGKELLARHVHDRSPRAGGPFVAVNCAALPETLLESELFGHARGAFTGADHDRDGRIGAAEGGTLFLDEIGDVALPVQVKLLRFLQDREYTPLGRTDARHADVRVIAATHRDLPAAIAAGDFREDLYYRLNVVNAVLPPLRERREDIPELAVHFLTRYADRYGRSVRAFDGEALDRLAAYDYPGNIRELENIVEQTVVLCPHEVIGAADLPQILGGRRHPDPAPAADVDGDLPGYLDRLERRIVSESLARHRGNQSETARHLGLTESGLRYKLRKWEED